MFGIGMTEMIVIAVIALIFIGPDQIPQVARTVGRFLNELRRSTDDIKRQFSDQAGLPRDFSGFDEWQRRRDQMQLPANTAENTDTAETTYDDTEKMESKNDSDESGNA